jgi:lysophospholipase L1-like esterase
MMRIFKLVVFSLIPLLLLLTSAEIVLRGINFQYSDSPLEMRARLLLQEGYTPTFISHEEQSSASAVKYKKDSHQMWVPRQSFAEGHEKQKKPDVLRVISMGCSCTAGCVIKQEENQAGNWSHLLSYPGLMGEYLNVIKPGKFEVLNAGVGGHSSYQGLQRLKREVLKYNPDIVTIFYGWNDHWVSSLEDKDARVRSESVTALINFFEIFRTYQALHKMIQKMKPSIEEEIERRGDFKLRVHQNDYVKNLSEMIDLLLTQGSAVVLMTAPYDLSDFQPAPIYPGEKEELIVLHESYNDIVRKMAEIKGVVLLDLAAEFNVDADLKHQALLGDGIHFSEFGCDYVARRLTETIVTMEEYMKQSA